MPPLADLSVNRPGKPKQANLTGPNTTYGKGQPPSLLPDSSASSLPAASAIQSMLKNTTELGDIGQFAVKPTKPPRYNASIASHSRAHQHRKPGADPTVGTLVAQRRHFQSQHDQPRYPLHHNQSLRSNGEHSFVSDSQGQHSGSTTQSSIDSRRVSLHPSLHNVRPYPRVGPRPRSPYAYPSRLKRPGHRPYSPAYSEINVSDSAIYTSVHRAYSTRTESPSSGSSFRKAPPGWNRGFNRSDILLRHRAPLPSSRRHDGNRSPPFLRRAPFPSSPLASHRSSFVGKPRFPKTSDSGSSGVSAASPIPLFYDYSEPFERESFHHTAHRSSMYESRHIPQSDGSSEGYQADVTNTSNMSSKESSSSTESKAVTSEETSLKAKRPSPLRFVSRILKQQPAESNKASVDIATDSSISSEIVNSPSDDGTVIKVLAKDDVSSNKGCQLLTAKASMERESLGSSATPNDLQRPPSIYDPAPKVIKMAAVTMRLSSSSSGSQYSSSPHSRQNKNADPASIKAPGMTYERQPKALSVSFNRLEIIHHELENGEPQQRAVSLDTYDRPEPCQIFAPVPERSMSSRDSRDRFSRILSIGEDFGKRDFFNTSLSNKKAPITIQQYLRDRKPPVRKYNALVTKELPPLPDDPPPVPYKGKEKAIQEPHQGHQEAEQSATAKLSPSKDTTIDLINGLDDVAALCSFERPGIPLRCSSMSKDSLFDLPESSRSVRTSLLSQIPSKQEQPRRFALTQRNSSLFQTMKELPPLPKETVVPVPPLSTPSPLELPCSFTPLMPEERLDTAVADIKNTFRTEFQLVDPICRNTEIEQQTPPRIFKVGYRSDQGSNASRASNRPWNLDANYPWAGTPPKLEVSIPQPIKEPVSEIEKLPRFKFGVRRSSLLGSSGKLLKSRPANVKVLPSSARSKEIPPVRTRFIEGFDAGKDCPLDITLMPLSPGLHIEAQSFFSDDSSQKRQKSSLRRRISQIRGAIRTTSSDNVQAQEQANTSSALDVSRPSKGSGKRGSTVPDDESPHKSIKLKLLQKIKVWFHHKEEKVKQGLRKLKQNNRHARGLSTHYPRET